VASSKLNRLKRSLVDASKHGPRAGIRGVAPGPPAHASPRYGCKRGRAKGNA